MATPPDKNIFQKIIDREIPAEIVYEDDRAIVFHDIAPQAPVHLLIVPKSRIESIATIESEQCELLGHLLFVARWMAQQQGVAESGFRLVINSGADGGQEVPHLHIHLLGGRAMTWPPG